MHVIVRVRVNKVNGTIVSGSTRASASVDTGAYEVIRRAREWDHTYQLRRCRLVSASWQVASKNSEVTTGQSSSFLFSFFSYVYVHAHCTDLEPYGQFWGLMSFCGQWWFFTFVFTKSSSGDVKGLLGTFPRCDRVLLGVIGHRPKVMGYVQ